MTVMDSAFMTWFLRTRMSFYEDEALELPWWFGLFCWNFTLAGIAMLLVEPQYMQQPQSLLGGRVYPYRTVAWLLMLVQSPLSFNADYVHMTHDSYWHVLDRAFAFPLMLSEVGRFLLVGQDAWKRGSMPLPLVALGFLALVFAVFSFSQSQKAQEALDREGFVFWHNLWHVYPLLAAAITLINFYGFGGWKESARKYFYSAELHLLKQVA